MTESEAVDQQQADPNSWVDSYGQEWCYVCTQQVLFFKEGWICSATCPAYLSSDEPGGKP